MVRVLTSGEGHLRPHHLPGRLLIYPASKGDEDQGQAGAASPHSTSKRRIKLAEEPPSFSKATTETDADDRVHYSVDVPSATALSEPPSSTWSLQNLSSPRLRALQTHSSHLFPDAITVGIFSLDEAERHFDLCVLPSPFHEIRLEQLRYRCADLPVVSSNT